MQSFTAANSYDFHLIKKILSACEQDFFIYLLTRLN